MFWDERYSEGRYVYGEEPNAFLAEHAAHIPRGSVLCLAEGEGRNAVHLASLGHRVLAVDQSEIGLAKARRLAAARGVKLETMPTDLSHCYITPGRWAGIVAIFAHLPALYRRMMHREVVTGLQPGGVFILEAYTPAQLGRGTGGPQDLDMLMTLDELREDLAGLELLVAREVEREIVEGDHHTGPGAVVQVVAKRPGSAR